MLLDLDKFYNSNYKDFVHKEALEEALKNVPEAFLKGVDTKVILSITFSVDDVGENPIYVTYLDKDNKEHIVKIRPNITEQLTEVLERYPTKVEMNEALEELKATITNEYTIFVNAEVETLNNTINSVNTSLTQAIRDTLDEAKQYTDTKHNEALTAIEAGDTQTLEDSKAYTDTQLETYATKAEAENANKVYGYNTTEDSWTKCDGNFTVSHNASDITKIAYRQTVDDDEKGIDFTTFATKDYTNTKHNEALTAIEAGDTQTLEDSKAYTDTKHNETLTAIESGDTQTLENSKAYTDTQLETYATKVEAENANKVYGYNTSDTSWVKCNGNFTVTHDGTKITDLGYRQTVDGDEKQLHFSDYASKTDVEPLQSKLQNVWDGHKTPFIYWLPNIDVNTMKLENAENDVKVTLNDGDVVYWRKNAYQPSGAELKVGFGTELPKTENSIVIRADRTDKTIGAMYFTAGGDTAYFRPDTYIKANEAPLWSWAGNVDEKRPSSVTLSDFYDGYIRFNIATYNSIDPDLREVVGYMPRSMPVTAADVEALAQEQNATNTENVSVSLQQKARTVREVTNNSTLVETKDFYILNLDFSFVPNVLPTSIETSFIENIIIDAPEFNGKSFNITFKANDYTATSKGVVGEPLNIKTCAVPIDETIKIVEVVVKDKIIIRKETE